MWEAEGVLRDELSKQCWFEDEHNSAGGCSRFGTRVAHAV